MTADRERPLRLLADENVQRALVQSLRSDGLDVAYVAERACGITDHYVIQLAVAEHRLLLTEDKDFGELVFRFKIRIPGVVLIRLSRFEPEVRRARLRALIDRYSHGLYGRYAVVEGEQFRLRNLPEPTRAP